MGDLGSSNGMGVVVVLRGFIFSLCVWGGGLRTLMVLFLVVLLGATAGVNFISFDSGLLVCMVYISGLGVVFLYLVSLDLRARWGLRGWLFLVGVAVAARVKGGRARWLTRCGGSFLTVFSVSWGIVVGGLLVVIAFVFVAGVISQEGVRVRSC